MKFTNVEKCATWDVYNFWAKPVFFLPEYLSTFKMQPTPCINPEYLTERVCFIVILTKRNYITSLEDFFPKPVV